MVTKIDQPLITNFRSELGNAGDDASKLRALANKIDKVIDELRQAPSIDMNADVHQLLSLQTYADSRLFQALSAAVKAPVTRFTNVEKPTKFETGGFVSSKIEITLDRDASGKFFVHTAPEQDRPEALKLGLESMFVAPNAEGGVNLHLPEGTNMTGAKLITASLADILPKNDPRYTQLEKDRFPMDAKREMLVIANDKESDPTIIFGRSAMGASSVYIICERVTVANCSGDGDSATLEKPVVYLYPTKIQDVRVEVKVDGEFACQYPKMEDGAWNVKAGPTGEIFDPKTERRFPYLFWESKSCNLRIDPAQSHCVASKDAEAFLENAAKHYALNDRERTDFVSYWLPTLEHHKHTMVQFLTPVEYARYAEMTVTPTPDTTIRLFMLLKALDKEVAVGSPALPTHKRVGFTVVEWGGAKL